MTRVPVESLLPEVEKPSRYLGRELNSVHKPAEEVRLRAALAFPDLYEVGMSHLGSSLLYALGNQAPGVAVERVFLPGDDLAEALKKRGLPLFTLESKTPLGGCDVVGVTLQSELTFTNILTLLDLGFIPLHAKDRGEGHPLVVGGGPCAFNAEPLSDFFDLFFLGEGEEGWPALLEAVRDAGPRGGQGWRSAALAAAKRVPGVYDPRDFTVSYLSDGTVGKVTPVPGAPETIDKALFTDFERPVPEAAYLVPFLQAVHDRVAIEVARGCSRGCRFCHAGVVTRPVRERPAACALADAERALAATGYEDVSLLSLSVGDYQGLDYFLSRFMDRHASDKIAVSLPSMRVGTLDMEIAAQIGRVRRTSFTIAPEAGSERLRRVINKPFTDAQILDTARAVFARGWEAVKLYFMIGLPTETDEDLAGIIALARQVAQLAPAGGRVTVNLSPFVPKGNTPFQWAAQPPEAELLRRLVLVRDRLKMKKVQVRWGRTDQAAVEGLLARGDRRVGAVIEEAWRTGARMDGWQEHFRFDLWQAAVAKCGLSLDFYCGRERGRDEAFPWEHLSCGVTREFLWKEWERARAAEPTPDCREAGCTGCGACTPLMKKNIPPLRPAKPVPPAESPDSPPNAEPAASPPPDREGGAKAEMERKGPGDLPARRIRVLFAKTGGLRFLGHLETIHAFERAARRSRLPLAFSHGFSPKPKINFALSLPLGVEATAEWADLEFAESVSAVEVAERLNLSLPVGMRVTSAWKAPRDAASLNSRVEGTVWRAEFSAPIPGLPRQANEFAARSSIPVVREKDGKSRTIELAHFIRSLAAPDESTVLFSLTFSEAGSVRPQEVLTALLGPVLPGLLLTRTGLLMRLEGGKGNRPGMSRVWD